jgi:predicted PurR-regulated permease PerM
MKEFAGLDERFMHRLLAIAGIVLLMLLVVCMIWFAIHVWFALLIGILVAVFLRSLSNWVERHLKIRHPWALLAVLGFLFSLMGLTGLLLAAPLSNQFQQLQKRLPEALNQLGKQIDQSPLSRYLPSRATSEENVVSMSKTVAPPIASFFKITVSAVAGASIALFLGLYMAFNPAIYFNGLLHFFPVSKRPRIRVVLVETGAILGRWIFGQLCSAICVGILIGVGLYICQIPLSLALGIIAGVLDLIPLVGPVLAAIPAILLGFTIDPLHGLLAFLVFVVANQIEEHVLLPLIHRYAVWLPPALTLFALFLMTVLFGLLGTLLATPLTAMAFILIKRFYLEDVLKDQVDG